LASSALPVGGVGVDPAFAPYAFIDSQGRSNWGLTVMNERAQAVGASLRVMSVPAQDALATDPLHGCNVPIMILVVDDHALMRATPLDFVQHSFFDMVVERASDSAQAIAQMGKTRPDLILMDVHLPDANGIDLIKKCRAPSPSVQVIVLSHSVGMA